MERGEKLAMFLLIADEVLAMVLIENVLTLFNYVIVSPFNSSSSSNNNNNNTQ